MKRVRIRSSPAPAVLPTYQELAALVAELTVLYVANVDGSRHEEVRSGARRAASMFVTCRTPSDIPEHWQRAIDAREALIEHRVVERKGRDE